MSFNKRNKFSYSLSIQLNTVNKTKQIKKTNKTSDTCNMNCKNMLSKKKLDMREYTLYDSIYVKYKNKINLW